MNKVKILSLTILSFLVLSIFCEGEVFAGEKRKVLLLQVIEENWDNLEFWPPLRRGGYKPPTKKEAMERKLLNVVGTKEGMIKGLNYRISKGKVPKDLKFYVVHTIKYFGKTGEMNDEDIVEESIYRFDKYFFGYYYGDVPEKISLLTKPKFGNKNDISPLTFWRHFEYIRLVEDLHVLSSDNSGNLKIKYDKKVYNLKVGDKIEFPMKVINLSKDEMINFTKKYKEEKSNSSIESISVKKDTFYFKTKVIIINQGYVEVEL